MSTAIASPAKSAFSEHPLIGHEVTYYTYIHTVHDQYSCSYIHGIVFIHTERTIPQYYNTCTQYTHIHSHIHAHTYTHMHTNIHTHSHTYTHIYIFIHTYTHTYMDKYSLCVANTEAFTMDSNLSRAVTEAFVRFHEVKNVQYTVYYVQFIKMSVFYVQNTVCLNLECMRFNIFFRIHICM